MPCLQPPAPQGAPAPHPPTAARLCLPQNVVRLESHGPQPSDGLLSLSDAHSPSCQVFSGLDRSLFVSSNDRVPWSGGTTVYLSAPLPEDVLFAPKWWQLRQRCHKHLWAGFCAKIGFEHFSALKQIKRNRVFHDT